TMTADDAASLAFDTGNDGVGSNGHEDQFVQGGIGGNPSNQSHWVFNSASGLWSLEDAPYNPNLPNHAGLASAWGFGASPALGADHRMYEFAIPLALLVSGPNQTLGFFGGSQQSPGVVDFATFQYSLAQVRRRADSVGRVRRPDSGRSGWRGHHAADHLHQYARSGPAFPGRFRPR